MIVTPSRPVDRRRRNTSSTPAHGRGARGAASPGVDLIDVPFLDPDDMEGLASEAGACAEIGSTGKGAIHPARVPVISDCFSPSPEDVECARRVVAGFEGTGGGVVDTPGVLPPYSRSTDPGGPTPSPRR